MPRMKWWLLWWLVILYFMDGHSKPDTLRGNKQECKNNNGKKHCNNVCKKNGRPKREDAQCCMECVKDLLEGKLESSMDIISTVEDMERFLEDTEVSEQTNISNGRFVVLLHKPHKFDGLQLHANEEEVFSEESHTNSKVNVKLPKELNPESNDTILFCMINLQKKTIFGSSVELFEDKLIGLSVRNKKISGLREHVNITINSVSKINETMKPSCQYYDFSTRKFSKDGCVTLWERNQSHVTCSCNHLTYFGVLMVSASVSDEDQKILTYITVIGCSVSLFALVVTVVLFFTNNKAKADVSMKVHINLAIALILLNLHFLPSEAVAALSSNEFCTYMAIALHYSLLASFSWMAVEGFHLYWLLVKVFNIYVRRYLLKLSVVGWGVPAVIVSLVLIINKNIYGHVSLGSSNSTQICYIRNDVVKATTTVGVFSLVFLFNMAILVVTVRRVLSLRNRKEFGQSDRNRAKRDICTLLGITALLGITWGLIFFSFGYLTTPGLYSFCILNSLQGLFIFLWFVMSVRKAGKSKTSSETRSTNT